MSGNETTSSRKTIDTLVEDIQEVLLNGKEGISDESVEKFGKAVAEMVRNRLTPEKRETTLRMSSIGQPCERKLYLEYHYPDKVEKLSASTKFKFLFGDLIEETLLFLAEVSGHRVEGRQSEQEIAGIKGHRDAVIDGTLTDVKSASSYSFSKFKEGGLHDNDPFGYVTQIQSYLEASKDDPIVTDKGRAAFLVADKTLGHLCLDVHEKQDKDYEAIYERKKSLIEGPLPPRGFDPEPDGKSGNLKLGVNCSYCPVKHLCHDNIRTFLSYKGPVYLTRVVREPRMMEIIETENTVNEDVLPDLSEA